MDCLSPGSRTKLYRLRRLASRLCVAGLPWLGLGCNELTPGAFLVAPPTADHVRAQNGDYELLSPAAVSFAQEGGLALPPPAAAPTHTASPDIVLPGTPGETDKRIVPISLDTVMRLAGEGNTQIAIAREKVCEACLERQVARYAWVPDLYVGPAFYRHEGGIQDQDGRLIHSSTGAVFGGAEINGLFDPREIAFAVVNAERKTWQQKGELTKITTETLLDAANTYIDFLTARTGEAIARQLLTDMQPLYERTKKLAATEPGARIELERVEAEMAARKLNISRLNEQGNAASAKLAYVLGLDPCVEIVPLDVRLAPFELVDANVPLCDLIARALAVGPGIREMEGLLALVHDSMERANGPARLLPTFQVRMAEGAFGAGPGSHMSFDNRWDLGLQARWNLTEFVAQRERRCITRTRMNQLHLSYDDLRRKLTAGVQEAYGAIHSDREQIGLAEKQIEHAREAYRLSQTRLENNIQGSSASEVLLSLQSLALSQLNYLSSVSDYDKDQIRLLILLGAAHCP